MDYLYKYKNELIELYSVYEFGKNLIERRKIDETAPWFVRGAVLVYQEALSATGIVLSYLPESPIPSHIKSFSPLTLASQIRILIDCYLSISYLLENKDDEKSMLQELVWEHAINSQRYRMVKQFNPDSPAISSLESKNEANRKEIEKHPLFNQLETEVRNNCLNGISDKIYTRNQLVQRLGLDEGVFWPIENHYSQFIHATAFAADQLLAIQKDPPGAIHFIYTLAANFTGFFSMNTLSLSEGLGIKPDQIPLGVFHTLLYWKDFFTGNYAENSDK